MESPVGKLTLVARGNKLAAVLWENDKPTVVALREIAEGFVSDEMYENEKNNFLRFAFYFL